MECLTRIITVLGNLDNAITGRTMLLISKNASSAILLSLTGALIRPVYLKDF